jgi:hypothetical protein
MEHKNATIKHINQRAVRSHSSQRLCKSGGKEEYAKKIRGSSMLNRMGGGGGVCENG